jgi:hypothetical protein
MAVDARALQSLRTVVDISLVRRRGGEWARRELSAMNLSRLVYVSDAVRSLEAAELRALLETARRCNEKAGITGLLLASGGHFMQVLEGELEDVSDCFDRIRTDARHRNVQRLLLEFTPERLFPAWWMAHINVDRTAGVDRARLTDALRLGRTLRSGRGSGGGSRELVLAMLRDFKSQLLASADASAAAVAAALKAAG